MNDQHKLDTRKTLVPVIDTMPADLLTPLGVYLKMTDAGAGSFLLESVERGESVGRYSFIGAGPQALLFDDGLGNYDTLRRHFATHTVDRSEELPPFLGGAIGYLGFDCAGWFEPTIGTDHQPPVEFMVFDSVIAFDHAKQVIKIITLAPEGGTDLAAERNTQIRIKLQIGPIVVPSPARSDAPPTETTSNWTQAEFEKAVDEIKELIRAGECYQVVLSQCFSRPTSADPVSIYRAMRSLNPSPYMFLLQTKGQAIIGASPEMLVKASGRTLEYRPIAGTRPRGKSSEEDAQLADDMRADAKEVAEHLMLVDLGRNDLGRVAEYGTVNVDKLMSVEKYSHVQHLVTYLSARMRPELDRFDALAACFPAGTVSGAPKVRATEIIRSLEPSPRGIYAGAVGYFDYGGNMDLCIAIRTLILKDGIARVQAGAGIVADSIPASEYQETVNKARALFKAVEIAEARDL
jgi:anthranilate synthase component I